MPHPAHESVRHRFDYRCGYCGVDEAAVGVDLTIDHYHPRSAGGTDDLANLVYACPKCNQYKGDTHILIWLLDNTIIKGSSQTQD